MTVFVDENRDEFGVEPVLRRLPNCPVHLFASTNGGCGNRSVVRPGPGATLNCGR